MIKLRLFVCVILFFGYCAGMEKREELSEERKRELDEMRRNYPIHTGVAIGDIELLKEIIVKYPKQINSRAPGDLSPLMIAAMQGKLEISKYLVSKGAKINDSAESCGCTPLLYAAHSGNYEILEYLISMGAKIDVVDSEGESPISIPAKNRDYRIVKLVLSKKKLDPNRKNKNGLSALDYAKANEDVKMIELLNVK